MSINPVTQYPGKVAPATPDNPFGTARNITIPGDGTGTPWESALLKDEWALHHAMLLNAGMEPNGTPDSAENSQLFEAAKASIGNGANLLSNHNFLTPSPDDSQPPPDSTPRSYPPGFQIFSGAFANETTGILNLTYIDGRVSFSGGDLYFAVPNTGGLERLNADQFVASVADFDGKPRTRGVSFALVGDEYRVTVGIDALEDESANETLLGSVKFEQGKVATGHDISISSSYSSRLLEDQFFGKTHPESQLVDAKVGDQINGVMNLRFASKGSVFTALKALGGTIEGISVDSIPYFVTVDGVTHKLMNTKFISNGTPSILAFGASESNSASDNDVAIQHAFDWMKEEIGDLDGCYGIFDVNNVSIGDAPNLGGINAKITFDGKGMIFNGKNTSVEPALQISGKQMNIKNFTVRGLDVNHTVYTFGFIWTNNHTNIRCEGKATFTSGPFDFGSYTNTFKNLVVTNVLTFNVLNFTTNNNLFLGGAVKGIELTSFSAAGPKEAYNVEFQGADIGGAVIWNSQIEGDNFGSPLILTNCNYEGDFTCQGNIKRRGGASLPSSSSVPFWDADTTTTYYSDYQFSNKFKGYFPNSQVNIQANGDASAIPSNMTVTAGSLISDTNPNAIVGDKRFRWTTDASADFPRLYIALPDKYLGIAKKTGYYTVSFFITEVSGFSTMQSENDSGETSSGVNLPVVVGEQNYITFTVKVNQNDTFSRVFIQGVGAGTVKDIVINAIAIHIGDASYPWTKSPEDI